MRHNTEHGSELSLAESQPISEDILEDSLSDDEQEFWKTVKQDALKEK